jgi:hypothetical protein
MLWKKRLTSEQMGEALWQLCSRLASEFYAHFEPEFRKKGLLNDAESEAFASLEVIRLHVWGTSVAINTERGVLDAFQGVYLRNTASLGSTDVDRQEWEDEELQTIRERFSAYHQAFLEDGEIQSHGGMATRLAGAALQNILTRGQPDGRFLDVLLTFEVTMKIFAAIHAVREFRARFKVAT